MSKKSQNTLLLLDVRSTYNVGAISRTCAAFGVQSIGVTRATPHPKINNDSRLPHVANRADSQIAKTALGAQKHIDFFVINDLKKLLNDYKHKGYTVYGLEHNHTAHDLRTVTPTEPWVLIAGNETEGIGTDVLGMCDATIEIATTNNKKSLNVSVAASIALYALTKDENQLQISQ